MVDLLKLDLLDNSEHLAPIRQYFGSRGAKRVVYVRCVHHLRHSSAARFLNFSREAATAPIPDEVSDLTLESLALPQSHPGIK